MPKLKRKSTFQRTLAMKSVMRRRREARDNMVDGGDGVGCSVAFPVGSIPDVGRDGPT